MATLEERFWPKVDKSGDCWLWTASKRNGYGQLGLWKEGRVEYAHRIAYELLVGPIPDGLVIDHLCRVRHCVNPAHMELVTRGENVRRGEGQGGRFYKPKTHCIHGHPLSGKNLYVDPTGKRVCRACRREVDRRRNVRRRSGTDPVAGA